jgi:hypothetical protein
VTGFPLRMEGRQPSILMDVAAFSFASNAMIWNPSKSYCCGILATLA